MSYTPANNTSTGGQLHKTVGCVLLFALAPITSATPAQASDARELSATTTNAGSPLVKPRPTGDADPITEIRRISGLTFDQLARVFSVTRRTLHLWVSGQRMQPANQEQVQRTLAALRRVDRGAPDLTLAAVLAHGAKALDLLAGGELEQFEDLLGSDPPAIRRARPRTSAQTLADRQPPPPSDLVQATQDGPHPAVRSGGARIKSMKATRIPRGK